MKREFKVDIALASDIAIFLEALLVAEFNEEFDAEEPCTDTFLDQFMPNGFVPNAELINALLASGIIKPASDDEPEFDSAGFSIADRFGDDDEEGSHHCDDLDCNCSF